MDCARSVDMGHEMTEDVNMGTDTHMPGKIFKHAAVKRRTGRAF